MKTTTIVLCVLACAVSTLADERDLTISLTTDRSTYPLGEPVVINHSVSNPTSETIIMGYACTCCEYELTLEDAFGNVVPTGPEVACPQVGGEWEFGPFETRIFEHGRWMQDTENFPTGGLPVEAPLAPGSYRLVATWNDRGRVASAPFVICEDDCDDVPRSYWIPAAGNNTGLHGTRWRTDLELQGLDSGMSSDRPSLEISLFPHGVSSLDPSEVVLDFSDFYHHGDRIENVLDELFGFEGHAALHIEVRGGGLFLRSRTFNLGADGTYGQVIPAIPASDARPGLLLPVLRHESDRWRSNIGVINPTGEPKSVTFILISGQLWSFNIELGPYEYRQINDVFAGKDTLENGTAYLICHTGPVLGYGSVIDNRTGDATFVRAIPLPAVLQ